MLWVLSDSTNIVVSLVSMKKIVVFPFSSPYVAFTGLYCVTAGVGIPSDEGGGVNSETRTQRQYSVNEDDTCSSSS